MEAMVQQRWYEIARREAVSEKDCERIATSFVYEGFRLPL
jgi:serine/threonine-protein kinase HipA